jgi:DNA-binding transcriptional LysR family regulator
VCEISTPGSDNRFSAAYHQQLFWPAGRALGLQKSKLSRHILLLEERLGVRLLNRSSRRFSITEIGGEYYDRCAAVLVEMSDGLLVSADCTGSPPSD